MSSSRTPLPKNGDDHLTGGLENPSIVELVSDGANHAPPMFGPAYQTWVRTRIEKHIEEAEKFASIHDFTSALHTITLGYIMSPIDESLRICEQRILALQQRTKVPFETSPTLVTGDNMATSASEEEDDTIMVLVSDHIAEADRLHAAHRFNEALDEIAKALRLDPSNESIQRYERTIHDAYLRAQAETQERIRRAKELCVNRCYEEALEEIALGLVDEPSSGELLELEKEILREHPVITAASPENPVQGAEERVRKHLETAEEFRKGGRYAEALDEISKAYAIDPANEEIAKTEGRIRDSEAGLNQPRSLFLSNPFRNRRTPGGRS
jgi:tetratricopeptide (TPR) repeat protein